jgi:Spy/CpxP family protein refolding chaperone
MPSKQQKSLRTGLVTALLTATISLAAASTAVASPETGGPHNMPMSDHCDRDWGHGMHHMRGMHMRPHNAAEHFLKMKSALNLSDDQIKRITAMRDDYISKNATAEEQLEAANDDLGPLLYADDVDLDAVNAKLDKIGKLEGQLWRAYTKQLHDIKALLTAEQKKNLNAMWQDHRQMRESMPMPSGDMPMHRGM